MDDGKCELVNRAKSKAAKETAKTQRRGENTKSRITGEKLLESWNARECSVAVSWEAVAILKRLRNQTSAYRLDG